MSGLTGKVALVTGGSRGIGAEIARRLAADGAAVAITYASREEDARSVVSNIGASGGSAIAIQADGRNGEEIESAVAQVLTNYSALDILVNNAGIFVTGDLLEFSEEDLDHSLSINLRAPFIAMQAAGRHLRDGGRIINIGSNLASRVPWPGISLYAMTKSGLVGLTKGAARDFGPCGITVNVVHPGSTNTDMNPADGDHSDLQRGAMAIPRYNEASDVASLVRWLAGPEGRSVTGAEFTIDGGSNA
ncbi:3-ketoacyl-ACP reductase [Halomonas cupida]|uniref:3-ketoacyl-ACP reductase n=1 Tax=Halomonas cupida TaxID=44933 RepID=A0A1M7JQL4_9GAMM|nr:SDR family oxidoreductase [Halomonas cupida]GEN24513.1 3-ketoacyl-ACP reductase [Halomonas cupida]SHM55380.1 NAD(P)-dependent dehydrogenase, short-chain alcohol dehydrogenase family [Halomonas cupida]